MHTNVDFPAPAVPTASALIFGRAAELDPHASSLSDQEDLEEIRDDFEFAVLCDDPEIAAADEIFFNGQIRPVYPLFDEDLFRLYQEGGGADGKIAAARVIPLNREERAAVRAPLRRLMSEEACEEEPTTSASEEEVELDGVPPESYCLWSRGAASVPPSPELRRKSKSTGSQSLRWKLRDLVIGRSHSDGKKKFVCLAHAASEAEKKPAVEGEKAARKEVPRKANMAAAHQLYYATGTQDRKRSYLPYRKDLISFLAGGSFR